MSWLRRRLGRSLIFLLAAILAAVFSINFCAWIFKCGCRSWRAGASASSNIHLPHVRHCPWCMYDGQGFKVAFTLILAGQAVVSFGLARAGWQLRLVMALAAFPLVGAVAALICGFISHYWS